MKAFYEKAGGKFQDGTIDPIAHTIKALAIGAGYTPNISTHEFLGDIPSGDRVASDTLTGKTLSDDGVFDADDPTFSNPLNTSVVGIVHYRDTGNVATSPLITIDTDNPDFPTTNTTINPVYDAAGIWKLP